MNRRNFVTSTAVIGAGSLPGVDLFSKTRGPNDHKEFYELRNYEMAFRGDRNQFIEYITRVLFPALTDAGANHTLLLKEKGDADPAQLWVLISYPDLETYHNSLMISTSSDFIKAASAYTEAGKIYNRYTTSLLSAFNGMPQLDAPGSEKKLFELRFYEGINEDAVRRKIMMFDDEEIDLFKKVGLDAVFFGQMIIGPFMPSLVYMLAFTDMEARSKAWGEFVAHPDWNRMKDLPKYANTVSNIRKIFLQPI